MKRIVPNAKTLQKKEPIKNNLMKHIQIVTAGLTVVQVAVALVLLVTDNMKLQFRAILPDGTYFYQRRQHLPSFFRRVLGFWSVTHPTYLTGELEDRLEILINDQWVKCEPPV